MKDILEGPAQANPALMTGEQLQHFYSKHLNWFEKIVGMNEEEFQKNVALDKASCMIRGEDGSVEFVNGAQKFKAGKFRVLPIHNLLNSMDEKHFKFNAPYPILDIITRIDAESAKYVDFSYLQSLPEYVTDCYRNQGALAAISCGGSAVARYYCAHSESSSAENVQTKEKQINLFEGLKDHFPVINGFIWLNNNEPLFRKKDWKKNLSKISYAYHTGCEVTSGYAFTEIDKSEKISVDQSFVAALNLSESPSGIQNKAASDIEIKAQFTLDAAYLSTYLLAISQQYTQLFLTLVGIELNNSLSNIYDSIFIAHQKWARHEHGKLKSIKLIVNEFKDVPRHFLKNLRAHNIPHRLTVYVNGTPKVLERFTNLSDET